MGCFDILRVDDCDGQVKLFKKTMSVFDIGDRVCSRSGTFSVKLRHGQIANILEGVWVSYTKEPRFLIVLDKWGGDISEEYHTEESPED